MSQISRSSDPNRPAANKTTLSALLNALRLAGRDKHLWPAHRSEILKMIEEVEDMAKEHDNWVECQDFGQPIPPEAFRAEDDGA